MADNLGPNQTRVVDHKYRNYETVIYQKQKPPLSSEANLQNLLISSQLSDVSKKLIPSGWELIGIIKDNVDENDCSCGDVLTSPDFQPNSFKLITKDNLIAWVNGWKIFVQGTNSTDNNNIIILPDPPTISYRIDFVFLEVWRKLIKPGDMIYKYGNVTYGGENPCSDLIDPSINIETSLRIQIQYRIRVVEDIDIENYPDGFDPNRVFVQGPLDNPINQCEQAYFEPVDSDPGLWRAGMGDRAAQEILQTVDGYVYAIPMFAVSRYNTGVFDVTNLNGASKSLSDYKNNIVSDRPDNKYNDWITSEEILDLRHKIGVFNYEELCEKNFDQLIKGKLQTKFGKNIQSGDYFGKKLIYINGIGKSPVPSWFDRIGGENADEPNNLRRTWCNSKYIQYSTMEIRTINDKKTGTPGSEWAENDTVEFKLINYPEGTTFDTNFKVWTNPTNISQSIIIEQDYYTIITQSNTEIILKIKNGNPLIGTTTSFTFEYTVLYENGPNGTTQLPDEFLEIRKLDGNNINPCIIAPSDKEILIPNLNDGKSHRISNTRENINEPYILKLIYYTNGSGNEIVELNRNILGYDIAGLYKCKINDIERTPIKIERNNTKYFFTFNFVVRTTDKIEFQLYILSKFFLTNPKTRGIEDTFEIEELTPYEIPNGTNKIFHIRKEDLSSKVQYSILMSCKYAYASSGNAYTITEEQYLNNIKSILKIKLDEAPPAGSTIKVPVIINNAIYEDEKFIMLYKYTPYQGLLKDVCTDAKILTHGPAIVTSAGSGKINYTILSNIIDRLPTKSSKNDSKGISDNIIIHNISYSSTIYTRIVSQIQDIIGLPKETVKLGLYKADRGRRCIKIDKNYAPLGENTLGLIFEALDPTSSFKKTYQSYLINISGRLYLLVVSSESDNETHMKYFDYYSENDTLDIFELIERPIIKG